MYPEMSKPEEHPGAFGSAVEATTSVGRLVSSPISGATV